MGAGVNQVILVGNLGNDPELKYTQGGTAVCSISVATTSVRRDKNGERVETTQWHRVKLFGKLGEIAGEFLHKGRQVFIRGSIRYDKYTGQDGVEKYFTDIVADEMQMLGGGAGDRPQGDSTERAPSRQDATKPARLDRKPDAFVDDDIPF